MNGPHFVADVVLHIGFRKLRALEAAASDATFETAATDLARYRRRGGRMLTEGHLAAFEGMLDRALHRRAIRVARASRLEVSP